MTKREIFDDIVKTMREDASFCKDIRGGDAQKYRNLLSEDMSERDFLFLVNRYLATFKLVAHLGFGKRGVSNNLPCLLREHKGGLFVVAAPKDSKIQKGHKIIAADGIPVSELREKYPEFFFEKDEDRRGIIWQTFLQFFDDLTLQSSSGQYMVDLPLSGRLFGDRYKFSKLRTDVCCLRFDDFAEEERITHLICEHSDEISNTKYLIIDVRNNGGGTDTAFLPLLKFCLKEQDEFCGKVILPEDRIEINYTASNVRERVAILEQYRKNASKEILPFYDYIIARNKELCGKGFVTEEDADSFTYPLQGTRFPERVFVLTDCNCGSSGDSFVQTVSKLDKVTVVGRPTMGILDYSNLSSKEYGDFSVWYPTSRRLAIDGGGAMSAGLPVDVYVPWTLEFLERDKDTEKVFEIIDKL